MVSLEVLKSTVCPMRSIPTDTRRAQAIFLVRRELAAFAAEFGSAN